MALCVCGDARCKGFCLVATENKGYLAGRTNSGWDPPAKGYEHDLWMSGYTKGCKDAGRCPECGSFISFCKCK